MFTWLTNAASWVWTKLSGAWLAFHNWVAKIAPGFKTFIVTALGSLGSLAATLQEYFTGIPLEKFVTGTQALIVTTILFSLAFWFRSMTSKT